MIRKTFDKDIFKKEGDRDISIYYFICFMITINKGKNILSGFRF